jgi:hypothetical protein
MEHWRGKTLATLVEKIKTTMPADWRTQLNDARRISWPSSFEAMVFRQRRDGDRLARGYVAPDIFRPR